LGLRDCLRSLQATNPAILLSPIQLRSVERDIHYIPAIASAVSRIVCSSQNPTLRRRSQSILDASSFRRRSVGTHTWKQSQHEVSHAVVSATLQAGTESEVNFQTMTLASAFEERLKLAIEATTRAAATQRSKRRKKAGTLMAHNAVYSELDEGSTMSVKELRKAKSPNRRQVLSPALSSSQHFPSVWESDLSGAEESFTNTPSKPPSSACCRTLPAPSTSPESSSKSQTESIFSKHDSCQNHAADYVSEHQSKQNLRLRSPAVDTSSVSADNYLKLDEAAESNSIDSVECDSERPMTSVVIEVGPSGCPIDEVDDDDWL
jgi:hypothetical protein